MLFYNTQIIIDNVLINCWHAPKLCDHETGSDGMYLRFRCTVDQATINRKHDQCFQITPRFLILYRVPVYNFTEKSVGNYETGSTKSSNSLTLFRQLKEFVLLLLQKLKITKFYVHITFLCERGRSRWTLQYFSLLYSSRLKHQ